MPHHTDLNTDGKPPFSKNIAIDVLKAAIYRP